MRPFQSACRHSRPMRRSTRRYEVGGQEVISAYLSRGHFPIHHPYVGEKVREEMRSQIVWGLASPYQGFGFYTL